MPGTRRAKCKRNNQRGGGLGSTYGFTASSYGGAGTISNPMVWTPASSCMAAPRPGFMENGYTGPKGLPGMSGGRRKGRKGSRKSGRKGSRKGTRKLRSQAGGRYGFDGSDLSGMGTPWGSARAAVEHVPCEASRTAIPDSGAAGMLNKVGGPLWDGPVLPRGQMGGAYPATASASDSAVYEAPTAGYTHLRNPGDSFQTAAGTYEMINVPENARVMSAACLKTGGGRKRSSRKQKKSRKGRKNRKGSRKGSRKN
jgi:hypothetical protein